MKKEQIVDFTRRISQANRSGLVVVMYDIFSHIWMMPGRHTMQPTGMPTKKHCGERSARLTN